MITKEQSNKLKELIKEHAEASINDSWAGSLTPEEAHSVRLERKKAERELNEYIRYLDGSSQRIGD